jgi:o-succinylbenzoate---CoA ligase
MKPLRLVSANDSFACLNLIADVLEGKCAGFIYPQPNPELLPDLSDLPAEVESAIGLIIESSGSTGTPKRISLSLAALLASAKASQERIGSGQWLLALPLNFVAGANVLIRSVLADNQPVMMNTQLPFTPEAFVRAASLMRGKRYTSLVPYQLAKLTAAAKSDEAVLATLKSFSTILVGGQAVSDADLELRDQGVNLVVSYGMTETCGGCVYDGIPLTGVDLEIDAGRIVISGPTLAQGLGHRFVTPDLGELVDGKLQVLGRADRVIISGGLKLSLDSIEQHVKTLPGVTEVIATAIDSEFGASLGLIYSASDELDLSSLQQISPAAKPKAVLRVDQVPRLPNGKPDLVSARRLLLDSMEA